MPKFGAWWRGLFAAPLPPSGNNNESAPAKEDASCAPDADDADADATGEDDPTDDDKDADEKEFEAMASPKEVDPPVPLCRGALLLRLLPSFLLFLGPG